MRTLNCIPVSDDGATGLAYERAGTFYPNRNNRGQAGLTPGRGHDTDFRTSIEFAKWGPNGAFELLTTLESLKRPQAPAVLQCLALEQAVFADAVAKSILETRNDRKSLRRFAAERIHAAARTEALFKHLEARACLPGDRELVPAQTQHHRLRERGSAAG